MKFSKMLEVWSNSKAITLVFVIEMLFHAITVMLGSYNGIFHFAAWSILFVGITCLRFYFNKSFRFKTILQLIEEDELKG